MRGRRQGLELHLKTENRFSAKASRTPHHPSAAHRAALRCAPQLPPRRKHVSGRKSGNPANLRDPRPSTHSSLSWQRRSRIGSQAKVSGGTIIANHRLRRAHTAAKPHARNACQGTYPPSRRPQLVLRGPSEGEEATKKLLAIGSVKRKLPSPPRHQEKPACGRAGTARARIASSQARSSHPALNTPTGLTFISIWLGVVRGSAARAAPAAAIRAQPALCPAGALAAPKPLAGAPHARSSRFLTPSPQAQASPTPRVQLCCSCTPR
jgi:hypothetical protein